MMRAKTGACAAALALWSSTAYAQQPRLPGSIELTVGAQLQGTGGLGSRDAQLTTATGGGFRLFTTSSDVQRSAAVEARLGAHVFRSLDAEAFGEFAKPEIQTSVTGDAEGAAGVTASETVRQYVVGGGITWYLPRRVQRPRVRTFVLATAAYLRQLHDSDTLAVTGRQYDFGGGLKYVLMTRVKGGLNAAGVRADARVLARTGGIAFDESVHYGAAVTAALFLRF